MILLFEDVAVAAQPYLSDSSIRRKPQSLPLKMGGRKENSIYAQDFCREPRFSDL